jgi:hypothetical protein
MERMKHLNRSAIEVWNRALAAALDSRLSEVQTVAMMVDLSELFNSSGFDQEQSRLLLARLAALPPGRSRELSELIHESRLDAAMLLIRHDPFFDRAELRPEVVTQTFDELRAYLDSTGDANRLSNAAPLANNRP